MYTAMERGTVDAVSFPYTYAHAAYQMHTISNWYTSNLSPGNVGVRRGRSTRTAFAKLPPQYQKLLQEAQPEAYKAMIAGLPRGRQGQSADVQVEADRDRYSEADLKRFREIAGKPMWDKWVADNKGKFDAQGVLDTLLKEIEKAKAKVAAK